MVDAVDVRLTFSSRPAKRENEIIEFGEFRPRFPATVMRITVSKHFKSFTVNILARFNIFICFEMSLTFLHASGTDIEWLFPSNPYPPLILVKLLA